MDIDSDSDVDSAMLDLDAGLPTLTVINIDQSLSGPQDALGDILLRTEYKTVHYFISNVKMGPRHERGVVITGQSGIGK